MQKRADEGVENIRLSHVSVSKTGKTTENDIKRTAELFVEVRPHREDFVILPVKSEQLSRTRADDAFFDGECNVSDKLRIGHSDDLSACEDIPVNQD